MHSSSATSNRAKRHYALDALQSLPCGCVAGVYRAKPGEIGVVALEARGPHCLHRHHRAGRVIGLGSPDESGWED
ncbi:MAG: hypothetical protein ABR606_20315 [Vicinamibacterales bacterium]